MATILIDPFPATGHYNGSLRLANLLKECGHTVVYTGLSKYKEKIESEGYAFYMTNFVMPVITKDSFLNFWLDSFVSLFNNTCLNKVLHASVQYDVLMEKVKPDLVLLDVFQLPKSVVYKKHLIEVIGFDTMVASSYAPNVPPYSSAYIPKNSFFSKKYVDWLWFLSDVRTECLIFLHKILYFGNDKCSMYYKISQINCVPLENRNAVKRVGRIKIMPENFHELIVTPWSFDFPRPPNEKITYLEPWIEKRDELVLNERYLFVRDSIVELKKKHPDMKFIYASIGTVSENAPKREARFIRILMKYCRKFNDHRIVFSIGNNYDINTLKTIPESLYIFNHLPQLDILLYCDLMITHGGMNSLTECIIHEVPVIVYPLLVGNTHWDQNGNAARVVYHRIGVRGKINTMTSASLRKKINAMCKNYAIYKSNIQSMKEKLTLDTAAKRAITIIESLIKPEPCIARNLRDIQSLKNKKAMMFTFDDGPAENTTERLLDGLKIRNIRATFFVIGEKINMYSAIIKRQYREGHTVANHTYSHKHLPLLRDAEILREITVTNKLLYDSIGIRNKYMRAPYGQLNAHIVNISNMSSVFWSIDSQDWKYRDADSIYDTIIKNAKDGAIVLLHDLYETSVDGALRAIDELIRQGYVLISLEEAEQLEYVNGNINRSFSSLNHTL